jgi:hypothetical protein
MESPPEEPTVPSASEESGATSTEPLKLTRMVASPAGHFLASAVVFGLACGGLALLHLAAPSSASQAEGLLQHIYDRNSPLHAVYQALYGVLRLVVFVSSVSALIAALRWLPLGNIWEHFLDGLTEAGRSLDRIQGVRSSVADESSEDPSDRPPETRLGRNFLAAGAIGVPAVTLLATVLVAVNVAVEPIQIGLTNRFHDTANKAISALEKDPPPPSRRVEDIVPPGTDLAENLPLLWEALANLQARLDALVEPVPVLLPDPGVEPALLDAVLDIRAETAALNTRIAGLDAAVRRSQAETVQQKAYLEAFKQRQADLKESQAKLDAIQAEIALELAAVADTQRLTREGIENFGQVHAVALEDRILDEETHAGKRLWRWIRGEAPSPREVEFLNGSRPGAKPKTRQAQGGDPHDQQASVQPAAITP